MDKSGLIDANLLLKMVNASSDGIVVAEQEGDDTILIYVNEAFEKLTGYTSDEILYQDCRFLQGDDRDQEARKIIRQSMEYGKPCRVRLRNYRKDGSMFWNELSITPVFNDDDELTYFIGIQHDISAQVALEEKLQQASRSG